MSNGSLISTTTQGIGGQGGNINVNAAESLEIDGQGFLTQLTTQTFGSGNAGDINVATGKLILREGGQIAASASTPITGAAVSGNAGRININTSDATEISGKSVLEDTPFPSGLIAGTRGSSTTGNGGSIQVNTGRLSLQNGGAISVSADRGSTGQAGSLTINAASVGVSDSNSTISASSTSPKPAGDVIINTNQFLLGDGASISVSSQGAGSAGNLSVAARSIELNDQGQIAATSSLGNGGNIALQVGNTLLLRNNSQISTTAGTAQSGGNGGNITVNGNFIVAVPQENSNITANAFSGRGGNIRITTQGLFGIEPRSSITTKLSSITASSQFGISGTIVLNTPDVDPSRGTATLPTSVIDLNALIASSCVARRSRQGRFVIMGTGGLAPQPDDLANSAFPTYELVPQKPSQSSAPVTEADLMYRLPTGEIVLGRSCE